MGLLKKMVSPSGVPLEYHRVTDVMIITNLQTVINVNSYVTQSEREKELEYISIKRKEQLGIADLPDTSDYIPVFTDGMSFSLPYDQHMTIDAAYEYLKTLPEFTDAVDC